MWERVEENEFDDKIRYWNHQEKEDEVTVKKFEDDNTWDAFHNDTLIENYDTAQEAIEKGQELLDEL